MNKDIRDLKDLIDRYNLVRIDSVESRRTVEYDRGRTRSILYDIVNEFLEFISEIPSWKFEFMDDVFKFGRRIGKECRLSARDIEVLFNDIFPNYIQGGMLGCFISGLYHDVLGRDDEIKLDLRKYRGSISGLGYEHKNGILKVIGNKAFCLGFKMRSGIIEVYGYVGNYLGKSMNGGKIIVNGSARNWIGERMKDGKIVVEGNAGDVIGQKMEGGEIIIKGNAGFWVGDEMIGGVIRIYGDIKSISGDRRGGSIYVWRNGWVRYS